MLQFHETREGQKFFDSNIPKIIKALEKLADNICKETEQQVVEISSVSHFLSLGWKYIDSFTDRGEVFAVIEREV